MSRNKITAFLLVLFSMLSLSTSASAISEENMKKLMQMSEQERKFLLMYFDEDDLFVVSSTRSLKSITRIAENVEVVTAADIELMNAHTVAEALYNVTGVEIFGFVGPGALGYAAIHGSDYTRVAVMLDGVPIQNAGDGVPLGALPVQMIDRIEIIKGPASSTWGSSFGGVINILTKSVKPGNHTGGSLYASGGERSTSDLRAEAFGRRGRLGLYLFGGILNSDGLTRDHEFWHNNLFSKLTADVADNTRIDLSFLYHKSDAVQWDYLVWDTDAYDAYELENIYARAALTSALSTNLELNFSAWMYLQGAMIYENTVSTDERLWDAISHFNKDGLSGKLAWRTGPHLVTLGTDMENDRLKLTAFPGEEFKRRKYAVYVNDSINIEPFNITPGLRYDHMSVGGDILSPSLGMTFLASEDLLLRAVVSRGFHEPRLYDFTDNLSVGYVGNPGLKSEKIWSYEAGVEANLFDVLKAKLTLFYHDIDDFINDKDLGDGLSTRINVGGARTQGTEVELSTREYRGFKLKGGVHYERIKLTDSTVVRSFDITRSYGINTAVSYDSGSGLRAILQGHYMWFNEPSFWEARYNGFIMDFNVIKEIINTKTTTLEAFFTGHNILDASSYSDILEQNPRRWLEAGIRYRF